MVYEINKGDMVLCNGVRCLVGDLTTLHKYDGYVSKDEYSEISKLFDGDKVVCNSIPCMVKDRLELKEVASANHLTEMDRPDLVNRSKSIYMEDGDGDRIKYYDNFPSLPVIKVRVDELAHGGVLLTWHDFPEELITEFSRWDHLLPTRDCCRVTTAMRYEAVIECIGRLIGEFKDIYIEGN